MSNGQSRIPFWYALQMKSNRLLHVSLQSCFHGERKCFERRAVPMTHFCIVDVKIGLSFATKHMRLQNEAEMLICTWRESGKSLFPLDVRRIDA